MIVESAMEGNAILILPEENDMKTMNSGRYKNGDIKILIAHVNGVY